jgi:hypothetical protein
MIDPVVGKALGTVTDVADKLGAFRWLFAKLIGDPDLAAQHLGMALSEVRRTLNTLQETILEISYLSVRGQDSVDVRRALDRIELGELDQEVSRGMGSCRKIGNIYDRYLNAWLDNLDKALLGVDEKKELRLLFKELRDSDGWAVNAAEKLLENAKPLARDIRELLEKGDEAAAQQRVAVFTTDLRPTLEKLSTTMVMMLDLESQFIHKQRLT